MNIQARYLVGTIALFFMWPFVLLGYVAWWMLAYARAGWELAEEVYDWVQKKVGNK